MFTTFDIILGIVFLVFCIAGFFNGFINELFGKAAPVVAVWISILYYGKLVDPIEKYVNIHILSVVLSFLLVFVVVFIVLKIIQTVFKGIFGGVILGQLDKILGLFFGAVEGLAVVCVILIVLSAQPWFDVSGILRGSWFCDTFDGVIRPAVSTISGAIL